jgi:modulator of FtsH protease
MGALLGISAAPIITYYASVNPAALWQAGGATALFISGFGAYGYATRRDLAPMARFLFFALLGLIVFGLVMLFVSIPGGNVIYAVLGLGIFAGYTMYDFQRLRRADNIKAAPLLAASIFLDIFNVFLLLLSLFGGGGRN